MKKNTLKIVFPAMVFVSIAAASLYAEDGGSKVSIGGHTKITLLDGSAGVSTIGYGKDDTASDFAGLKFLEFIPFFKVNISDRLSLDVRPDMIINGIDGTTGATPTFGKAIGAQRAKTTELQFSANGFNRALVHGVLPGSSELSIGLLNTKFTWDYGSELFWEDEMNGSQFSCNPMMSDITGMGIDFEKYMEIGDATLPLYVAVLASESMTEFNYNPTAIIGLSPQIGKVKFHVAVNAGLWGSDVNAISDVKKAKHGQGRATIGVAYNHGIFGFRAEGIIGMIKHRISNSNSDAIPHGAYAKIFLKPWKRVHLCLDGNYVYYNFINQYNPQPGSELYVTITPSVQILTTEHSRIILQADLCNWKQNPWDQVDNYDKKLMYVRPTLGWRLTF